MANAEGSIKTAFGTIANSTNSLTASDPRSVWSDSAASTLTSVQGNASSTFTNAQSNISTPLTDAQESVSSIALTCLLPLSSCLLIHRLESLCP
jgi:hypothetical protein